MKELKATMSYMSCLIVIDCCQDRIVSMDVCDVFNAILVIN